MASKLCSPVEQKMEFSPPGNGCGVGSRKAGCTEGILGLWYLAYDGHHSSIYLTNLQLASVGCPALNRIALFSLESTGKEGEKGGRG